VLGREAVVPRGDGRRGSAIGDHVIERPAHLGHAVAPCISSEIAEEGAVDEPCIGPERRPGDTRDGSASDAHPGGVVAQVRRSHAP